EVAQFLTAVQQSTASKQLNRLCPVGFEIEFGDFLRTAVASVRLRHDMGQNMFFPKAFFDGDEVLDQLLIPFDFADDKLFAEDDGRKIPAVKPGRSQEHT